VAFLNRVVAILCARNRSHSLPLQRRRGMAHLDALVILALLEQHSRTVGQERNVLHGRQWASQT